MLRRQNRDTNRNIKRLALCTADTDSIKSNVSSVSPSSEKNEGPTLVTLDFTIRIGSTPTFLYFDNSMAH